MRRPISKVYWHRARCCCCCCFASLSLRAYDDAEVDAGMLRTSMRFVRWSRCLRCLRCCTAIKFKRSIAQLIVAQLLNQYCLRWCASSHGIGISISPIDDKIEMHLTWTFVGVWYTSNSGEKFLFFRFVQLQFQLLSVTLNGRAKFINGSTSVSCVACAECNLLSNQILWIIDDSTHTHDKFEEDLEPLSCILAFLPLAHTPARSLVGSNLHIRPFSFTILLLSSTIQRTTVPGAIIIIRVLRLTA